MNCVQTLDNHITIVRGDYLEIALSINTGSDIYPELVDYRDVKYRESTIYFALMEPNQAFEDNILWKEYKLTLDFVYDPSNFTSDGELIIKLQPQDTIYLHPGPYYYTIKIKDAYDNRIYTIINNSSFKVL